MSLSLLHLDPELAGLLAKRTGADADDRSLLAAALRLVAQRTTAANIRNWCLTRALAAEGTIDTRRLEQHRFNRQQVLRWPTDLAVHVLRVLLDPDRATGVDLHVAVELDGERAGLHFRHHVAATTDGNGATAALRCTKATWAALLAGGAEVTLASLLANGSITCEPSAQTAAVVQPFAALDHPSFTSDSA